MGKKEELSKFLETEKKLKQTTIQLYLNLMTLVDGKRTEKLDLADVPKGWVVEGGDTLHDIPWDNIPNITQIRVVRPEKGLFGIRFGDAHEAQHQYIEAQKKLGNKSFCFLFVPEEKSPHGYTWGPVAIEDLSKNSECLGLEMRDALEQQNHFLEHSKHIALLAISEIRERQ